MKIIPLLAAVCVAAGCATGPIVETDRDPAADFGIYHAYAWKQEPAMRNPLLQQQVVAAIDEELARKGWRRVPSEAEAEALLVGNVASREDATLDYFYEGNGWNGWDSRAVNGLGVQRVALRAYTIGTLVVDMFDARSKKAIWRAVAQGTVPDSEKQRSRDAMSAVRKMFREFPPANATGTQ